MPMRSWTTLKSNRFVRSTNRLSNKNPSCWPIAVVSGSGSDRGRTAGERSPRPPRVQAVLLTGAGTLLDKRDTLCVCGSEMHSCTTGGDFAHAIR